MDENFENHSENNQKNNNAGPINEESPERKTEESPTNNVISLPREEYGANKLSMEDKGNVRPETTGAATIANTSNVFVILGWISAALTFLISPLFAIAGIIFGVVANRQARGRGNAIIIVNIVLAAILILFGLIASIYRY